MIPKAKPKAFYIVLSGIPSTTTKKNERIRINAPCGAFFFNVNPMYVCIIQRISVPVQVSEPTNFMKQAGFRNDCMNEVHSHNSVSHVYCAVAPLVEHGYRWACSNAGFLLPNYRKGTTRLNSPMKFLRILVAVPVALIFIVISRVIVGIPYWLFGSDIPSFVHQNLELDSRIFASTNYLLMTGFLGTASFLGGVEYISGSKTFSKVLAWILAIVSVWVLIAIFMFYYKFSEQISGKLTYRTCIEVIPVIAVSLFTIFTKDEE